MDTTPELRYRELLAGFSSEELAQLPLEISVYGDDFEIVVRLLGNAESGHLPFPSFDSFVGMIDELKGLMDQLVAVNLASPSRLQRSFGLSRWREAQRKLSSRLQLEGSELYGRILKEYSFLIAALELLMILQAAIADDFGRRTGSDSSQQLQSSQIRSLGEKLRTRLSTSMAELDSNYAALEARFDSLNH